LRDVFILTLPAVGVVVYLVVATAASFYNVEIKNFHGYLTRNVRVAGADVISRLVLNPAVRPVPTAYLPLSPPQPGSARRYDLRIRGDVLDSLASALPGSGERWHSGNLIENGVSQQVEVRHRGQDLGNFVFRRKTWKIKTRQRELIDGYRVINLTSLEGGRLSDHLAFMAASMIGLPASRSRVVHLYLNGIDQGLYLQEEQIDESLIRRYGRMPGDVFYGELSFPNEAKLGSNDLFWNPFLWRKKSSFNRYSVEHRPHLTELLDLIADPSLQSWGGLHELLDDDYAAYFGLLSYLGDQHTDRAHNHKLYFSPLTGKFEGLLWNLEVLIPEGVGVETSANALFVKLCRDPRFLDRMHRAMDERFMKAHVPAKLFAEVERILTSYSGEALDRHAFEAHAKWVRARVAGRLDTVRSTLGVADLAFEPEDGGFAAYARSASSLSLKALELDASADGVRLWEDRDFDGSVSPGDRELGVRADGSTLYVDEEEDVPLYTGRDFRAPYHEPGEQNKDVFTQFRMYTRLAYLRSPFLLADRSGVTPRVTGLRAVRTVGRGPVSVHEGAPNGYVAELSIHPWRFPVPPEPREYRFRGTVELTRTLVIREKDRFEAEPGTRFLLGPGVSIVLKSRVDLSRITVERLDPEQPWGAFILQGAGASDSRIVGSTMRGGSDAVLRHVYYSGMFSAHHADRVVLENCLFADNLSGDDTVRFGRCRGLRIAGCRVEGANGDAIDCDISDGVISDTVIQRPRNDGIDLMTANVDLERNTVRNAGDKGISFGESANPEVIDCKIIDCVMGIGVKDGSDPTLRRVEIFGCRVGVSGYDKNWRYSGGGRGSLVDCKLTQNVKDVNLDSGSSLRLVRCEVDARFEPPADALAEGRIDIVDLVMIEDAR